ncbi:MAG: RNase adapter RapZ [Deltaproteobacteria bacterium]|uniref:RNase adapter RapZ n=1 Tax=Candidatus Zymogenus saltonus TaxID=2844893 RepID=A0A9D8KGX9_9DELT|nr:RNase adapter RapZ [Candidatus Zymogenus saltonus]
MGKKKDIKLLIITGLSGSGKSTVLKAVEDSGFYCIDNLPVVLLPEVLGLVTGSEWEIDKIGLVMDVRGRSFLEEYPRILEKLEGMGQDYQLVFMEANDNVLFRRYKETRRVHPLDSDDPRTGIEKEREMLSGLRKISHKVIDTSSLTPHDLRTVVLDQLVDGVSKRGLNLNVISFGYRYGNPIDADIVIDVRFLPNPYFVEELRSLSGLTKEVRDYVLDKDVTEKFLSKLKDLFSFLLPHYVGEGKALLTIAVGCTGGMHRSVVIAQELYMMFKGMDSYTVRVKHRDIKES